MVGDLVNSEAVQFPQRGITTSFDFSQGKAAAQRIKQFEELAGKHEMIAAAHLPFPGLGHIRKAASGWTFVPVDYRNRAGKWNDTAVSRVRQCNGGMVSAPPSG